jgi:NAD(P)-dependent dehydrogenase (short-subunit alcohol dehydrogenase family)
MSQKVVVVTGASRGLGRAIVQALLKQDHKVFAVARSEAELKQLKDGAPSSVDYFAADLADLTVCYQRKPQTAWTQTWSLRSAQVAPHVTEAAIKAFGRIDALVINHGVLSPISKIADSNAEEWRRAYDINVFGSLALVGVTAIVLEAFYLTYRCHN